MKDKSFKIADLAIMRASHTAKRAPIITAGTEALLRLIAVAQRDTGQSRKCRRFLLGCYNGRAFPFDLTELRAIDEALWRDCMAVLAMERNLEVEIHQRIEGGDVLFKGFWRSERPDDFAGTE